jgi:hypothetical protein
MNAARAAYRILVTIFVAGVVVQFYLAGAGVFRAKGPGDAVDSGAFNPHRALGDILIVLSLLVMIAAAFARDGTWRPALALFVLMIVTMFVAHAPSWGGAFHPLFGLAIAGLAGSMTGAAWRRHRQGAPPAAPSAP